MKKILTIIFSLIISFPLFSQPTFKIKTIKRIINTKIILLFPVENDKYLYKEFYYFKYCFWFIKEDTLLHLKKNIYKGHHLKVNIDNKFINKDSINSNKKYNKIKLFYSMLMPIELPNSIDTFINYIQNSTFSSITLSKLEDSARKYIGFNVDEFYNIINLKRPSAYIEGITCYDDYYKLNNYWFEYQLNIIKTIRDKKIERLNYILQSNSIKHEFIKNFLNDFGSCDVDFNALINIISKNADNFLIVCKEMEDSDFFDFMLKISDIPKNINTKNAILELKKSRIKTFRKTQIISKLK